MLQYDEELSKRLSLPLDSPPYTDSNNNSDSDKSGDKYSLRPRSSRRRTVNFINSPTPAISKTISKTRQPKPKQKPAPLSKYRRKTANARERSRMREINQAFESLRKAVPQLQGIHDGSVNEKLTKITTLRLAMKYISTLSAALSGPDAPSIDLLSDCSELDLFLESDSESLPLHSDFGSDHSLTPGEFSMDFPDGSLTPVDFSPLSPDLSHHLSHYDPFLSDFS